MLPGARWSLQKQNEAKKSFIFNASMRTHTQLSRAPNYLSTFPAIPRIKVSSPSPVALEIA